MFPLSEPVGTRVEAVLDDERGSVLQWQGEWYGATLNIMSEIGRTDLSGYGRFEFHIRCRDQVPAWGSAPEPLLQFTSYFGTSR